MQNVISSFYDTFHHRQQIALLNYATQKSEINYEAQTYQYIHSEIQKLFHYLKKKIFPSPH